ncbi:hypothetical protein ACHAWF_005194 [Thalassiosira exigua]
MPPQTTVPSPSWSSRTIDAFGGFAGLVEFSALRPPQWVDTSLPPGFTSMDGTYRANPDWPSLLTEKFLIFGPNFVWLAAALIVYFAAPYDYDVARDPTSPAFRRWLVGRAILNVALVLGYDGFFHALLYGLGWARRPFARGRRYRWSKTVHNAFYSALGALQWTAWEGAMVHLYATGKIGYIDDETSFGTLWGALRFCLACIAVPLFREFHFFFVHRFSHARFAYKYVHALHHRNTDVEPFSGLCMSPAEHLYYLSSVAPSIYWHASPFAFLFNGIHLILSPGASHSGWEDCWQSDQFHYAHHRFFECNYGTPGFPLDRWFGCFRESLSPVTREYRGGGVECLSKAQKEDDNSLSQAGITSRDDAKATLVGFPGWDQIVYHVVTILVLPFCIAVAFSQRGSVPLYVASLVAAMVAVGPLLAALVLSCITAPHGAFASLAKTRHTLLYPFHKEALMGKYGIMLSMTIVVSILPIYHLIHSLLTPDGNGTVYNRIWG